MYIRPHTHTYPHTQAVNLNLAWDGARGNFDQDLEMLFEKMYVSETKKRENALDELDRIRVAREIERYVCVCVCVALCMCVCVLWLER